MSNEIKNMEDEEIIEMFDAMFIKLGDAAFIPKNNPFAFAMYDCLRTRLTIFNDESVDGAFMSSYDFVLFAKRHFLNVDLDVVKMFSFRLKNSKDDE